MRLAALLGLGSMFLATGASAAPAKVLHQTTNGVIVRMGSDGRTLVWQEVGNDASKSSLFTIDLRTLATGQIATGKRPFGPSVSGGVLVYGAGDILKKVEVRMHDLATRKAFDLQGGIPWILEPAVEVTGSRVRAVWESSVNIDGDEMAIHLFEGERGSRGATRVLVQGPVLLKGELPEAAARRVHNEFPEISGDALVFQNNEFGVPNVYRMEISAGSVSRLAPSTMFQERPAVDGPVTAWEESDRGYAESAESAIFVHDARSGQARRVTQAKGLHYQVRVKGERLIYGAKREPLAHTPSVRVYDLSKGIEYDVSRCAPGAIYDWAATDEGLYLAQRAGQSSSRLLRLSWKQVEDGC